MTDKLAFSGSLEYVTYCIEKYLAEGYVLTRFQHVNTDNVIVEMEKEETTRKFKDDDIKASYSAFKNGFIKGLIERTYGGKSPIQATWTLQEQLDEAIELEDYEEAARLRDIINSNK